MIKSSMTLYCFNCSEVIVFLKGQENKGTTKRSSIKFCLNNEKSNRVTFFKSIIGNPTCVKIEEFDAITMVTNCHKISI